MSSLNRRALLRSALLGSAAAGAAGAAGPLLAACGSAPPAAPSLVRPDRPVLTHGVQSGDVVPGSGLVWTRADRPSRMIVEVADNPELRNARRLAGPMLTPDTDFTGRLRVAGTGTVYYRASAEDPDGRVTGEPVAGSFRTGPGPDGAARFVWSGDIVGQGWGINPDRGGMRIFSAMAARDPDFFLCSGDTVYADGPLKESVTLPDGRTWRNLVTPAKSKVAETLEEFRGQFAYNLLDENVRAFYATVSQLNQWDDHEVTNNWYPGEVLTDAKYTERSADVLAGRAFQALHEWVPLDPRQAVDGRVYRRLGWGPHLDVFAVDMRTYRDANGPNTAPRGRILGERQARWLAASLTASRATWKVVASDMPIGVLVKDGNTAWEAVANGAPGAATGREVEIAEVLRAVKGVPNVVWLTADVHYTAAHRYSPERAAATGGFGDFAEFWEFVSGPLHAGAGAPGQLDPTFGPDVVFARGATEERSSPLDDCQRFGEVQVAPGGRAMTVTLRGQAGQELWATTLNAR